MNPISLVDMTRHAMVSLLFVGSGAILGPGTAHAAETDPGKVVSPPSLALPAAGSSYNDPVFGTTITRISDPVALETNSVRPEYSQLQAWNADGSLLLLSSNMIVDPKSLKVVHKISYRWPGFGSALRWSPTNPLKLYYLGGGVDGCANSGLYEYNITLGSAVTGSPKLVRCFTEYSEILNDPSFEELSDDGRIVALVGKKQSSNSWGYVNEAFAFDVTTGTKHRPLALPVNPEYGPVSGDFVAASPSGKYILIQFGSGTARYRGLEAFDLEMNYVGKVHTGSGHADFVLDRNGDEWLVVDNANNSYLFSEAHYIVKAKIPSGVVINSAGNVDTNATVAAGLAVRLVQLDWQHNMHISCRNIGDPTWCAFSTYQTKGGYDNGHQPFENEIVRLYLDSTYQNPKVERLAHHRSSPYGFAPKDSCERSNYWAQPHATVRGDGQQIVFGSNWGRICDNSNPVDAFILDSASSSIIRPLPPKDVVVR